jgi:hypothetical protein
MAPRHPVRDINDTRIRVFPVGLNNIINDKSRMAMAILATSNIL